MRPVGASKHGVGDDEGRTEACSTPEVRQLSVNPASSDNSYWG